MLRGSHKVAIGLSIAATVSAASGCRTTRPTGECLGTEYLIVRNETRVQVDVYQFRGTVREFVGTASPGMSQLQFPAGKARSGRYVAGATGGGVLPVTQGGHRVDVTFEVACTGMRR